MVILSFNVMLTLCLGQWWILLPTNQSFYCHICCSILDRFEIKMLLHLLIEVYVASNITGDLKVKARHRLGREKTVQQPDNRTTRHCGFALVTSHPRGCFWNRNSLPLN